MKRFVSKLTVLLLCFALVFGALPVQAESVNNGFVTREQAIVSILNTVGYGALNETENDLSGFADASIVTEEYRDEIGIAVTNKILFGTGTRLDPQRNVTRLEFALFLSRTIRELPVVGDGISFTDVPQYAAGDVNRLVKAGLMFGYGDGQFGSGDYLRQEHLEAILDRVRGLENIRKQDDFFYAVNREWLINARLPAGYAGWGSFEEVGYLNDQRIKSIVNDLYSKAGTYEEGTPEQKIADFYTTILDMKNRNKQGMEPIKKYLDMIDSALTAQEILDIAAQIENETGFNPIFTFGPAEDLIDSSKYSLYGTGMGTILNSSYLLMDNPNIQAMYENFVSLMLSYLGYTPEQAVQGAKDIYAFERNLAQYTLSNEEQSKIENLYNPTSRSSLVSLFSNVDLDKYLNDLGYKSVETIIVTDKKLMTVTAELLNDQNTEIIKTYEKVHFLINTAQYLSKELQDTIISFNTVFLGMTSAVSDEDIAFNLLSSVMSSYLGRVFVEKYFSPEAKEDVLEIAQEIVNTFEKRIRRLDWMSESTKQAAIMKLKSIKFKIGYPDKWGDPYMDIDIKTYDEGGSLMGNIYAITAAEARYLKNLLGKPVDKSGWLMSPQTVNAYYNPLNNEIVFPAGILQPPFYDVNASREENLGGIGSIIAHEITHAFDPNGARFDENGNMKNWWTEEDYAVFEQKCRDIVNLYNGYEIAQDAIVNGNLTVSENVADIGGVACVLEIMKSIPNADYEAFFEKNAEIWRYTATPQMYQFLAQQDAHSPYKLRTNYVLRNFEEFYDTYDIKPGDWMYLEPEKRAGVW